MKCYKCGKENKPSALHCSQCGARLSGGEAPSERRIIETVISDIPGDEPKELEDLRRVLEKDYEILGLLGSGGMGRVYLAREKSMSGREVAIKALPGEYGGEFASRFLDEIALLAELSHGNIVTIYGADIAEGIPYYAMRYVKGATLSAEIERNGKLDPGRAMEIAAAVCEGLSHAHGRNIIHRDIKPSNILLGTGGETVIADFGISKALGNDRRTKTGAAVGTPEYMSPEQCMGHEVDHRSDLYSLGVVLYEMLTGRPPFEGEAMVVMYHHSFDPPPDIKKLGVKLPAGLGKLVKRLLNKKAGKRPSSAGEVKRSLLHLLRSMDRNKYGSAGSFSPGSAFAELKSSVKMFLTRYRRPVKWASALSAAGLCVALTVFFGVPAAQRVLNPTLFTENAGREILLDHLFKREFIISGDEKAFAYISGDERGEYAVVWRDGKVFTGAAFGTVENLVLCSRGERHAHIARTGPTISQNYGWPGSVIVDGKKSGSHDAIADLRLSDDGRHYVYRAFEGGTWERNKDGIWEYWGAGIKEFIVRDGLPGEKFDLARDLHMSSDGKHYMYMAGVGGAWERNKEGSWTYGGPGKKEFIVREGLPGGKFDLARDLHMSSDGKHYMYSATEGGAWVRKGTGWKYDSRDSKWFVVYDGKPQGKFGHVSNLLMSADGGGYVYMAAEDGEWKEGGDDDDNDWYVGPNLKEFVVRNGRPQKKYGGIGDLRMSDDGRHYMYWAADGGQWERADGVNWKYIGNGAKYRVVRDGKVGEEYDFVDRLLMSPDGGNYIFNAANGGEWVRHDNGYWLYVGREVKYNIIKNGEREKSYDGLFDLVVSNDGLNYVCIALVGRRWEKKRNGGWFYDGLNTILENGRQINQGKSGISNLRIYGDKYSYMEKESINSPWRKVERRFENYSHRSEHIASRDGLYRAFIETRNDVSFLKVERL